MACPQLRPHTKPSKMQRPGGFPGPTVPTTVLVPPTGHAGHNKQQQPWVTTCDPLNNHYTMATSPQLITEHMYSSIALYRFYLTISHHLTHLTQLTQLTPESPDPGELHPCLG